MVVGRCISLKTNARSSARLVAVFIEIANQSVGHVKLERFVSRLMSDLICAVLTQWQVKCGEEKPQCKHIIGPISRCSTL